MSSSPSERIASLLNQGVKLPPMPASGTELMSILRQPAESLNVQRIAQLVEGDPALALQVLRVANSPMYSVSRSVTRVPQAIVLLGLDETVQLLNYYLVLSLFPPIPALPHFDPAAFWLHAWGCSQAARALANPQYLVHCLPGELCLAGLLHDIGKAALAVHLPEEFGACLEEAYGKGRKLHEVERERLGTDHAELGAALMDVWRLPGPILLAVRGHHNPAELPEGKREMAMLLELANSLAHEAEVGESGNPECVDTADTLLYREGSSPLASPQAEETIFKAIKEQLRRKGEALTGKDAAGAEPAPPPAQAAPQGAQRPAAAQAAPAENAPAGKQGGWLGSLLRRTGLK